MKYAGCFGLLFLLAACSSETKLQTDGRPPQQTTAASPAAADTLDAATTALPDTAPYWQRVLADPSLKPVERKRVYVDETGYDFGWVWAAQNNGPLGFIGDNYERLRVIILFAEQDSSDFGLYHVRGKTRVRQTLCPFTGSIRIQHVREFADTTSRVDEETEVRKEARGVVVSSCEFREAKNGAHTGVFTGMLTSYWFTTPLDLKVKPDEVAEGEDGPDCPNNAFVGEWRSYDGKLRKRVAWGDDRIPGSGPLDVGAGEFMPDARFEKYGWKSYADAMRSNDEALWKKERTQWW